MKRAAIVIDLLVEDMVTIEDLEGEAVTLRPLINEFVEGYGQVQNVVVALETEGREV